MCLWKLLYDRKPTASHSCVDLLEGGDLKRAHEQDADPPYTEVQARRILKQILIALDRLHTLGVSHCDLKPENVLFTSRYASLGRQSHQA